MSRNVLVTKFLNAIILLCHCQKIVCLFKEAFCSPWQVKNSTKSHQLVTNGFDKKRKQTNISRGLSEKLTLSPDFYIYTPIFKNIAIWKKNIWNVYKQKVYIFHVYFKILMFFENWCIYTVLIFLDHVVITCSSRCIPGDFHLNKLVINYNQYLSTYLKQGKSAISWSSNSYKNIRHSIKINMNIHFKEGQEDQYSVELNSSFLTLAVSM